MKTPVVLVTGFLGSGKTTLISRLLERPELGETAVIVNELGEVGIDHHLLRRVDERTVVLSSGCVCCVLRGDLSDELRDLLDRRDAGDIPWFRRVVIETTGVARPAPIVQTLLADPLLPHHYSLDAIVATVDGEHGLRGSEAVQQVAAADTLVVTKSDLAEQEGLRAIEAELARLNPAARTVRASFGDVETELLLSSSDRDLRELPTGSNGHAHGPRAVVLTFDRAIDWTAFGIWLTMLLHARGEQILRIKGLLDVGGEGPLLLNCVQHAVYPPVHLDAWPDDDRSSRLVLIGSDVDRAVLEMSLRAFDGAARG
ncbi:MAG TPA: GTP-binding protein [Gaiellaceae bacterium]|nr:GTP-binding protein [Gaiellaceae bacterium]